MQQSSKSCIILQDEDEEETEEMQEADEELDDAEEAANRRMDMTSALIYAVHPNHHAMLSQASCNVASRLLQELR